MNNSLAKFLKSEKLRNIFDKHHSIVDNKEKNYSNISNLSYFNKPYHKPIHRDVISPNYSFFEQKKKYKFAYNKYKDIKINNLHFHNRTYNALLKNRIKTLGGILRFNGLNIYNLKGIGSDSFSEIAKVVKSLINQNNDDLAKVQFQNQIEASSKAQFQNQINDVLVKAQFQKIINKKITILDKIDLLANELKKRHRDIILSYYGLKADNSKNFSEIGKEYSITRQRVEQIIKTDIKKLKYKANQYFYELYNFVYQTIDSSGGFIEEDKIISMISSEFKIYNKNRNRIISFILKINPEIKYKRIKKDLIIGYKYFKPEIIEKIIMVSDAYLYLRKNPQKMDDLIKNIYEAIPEAITAFNKKLIIKCLTFDKNIIKIDSNHYAIKSIWNSGNISYWIYKALELKKMPLHYKKINSIIRNYFNPLQEYPDRNISACLCNNDCFINVGKGTWSLKEWVNIK